MSSVYSKVSNKDDNIDVNLAGTKLRNRRLYRQDTIDNTREIGDNSIIELGQVVGRYRPEERN